jgi:periplasmic copper chaperone A
MNRRLALVLPALLATLPAFAEDALEVQAPWARATAGRAPNGAAYLTIVNPGAVPDRLLAASAPVARMVELHTHLMDGGVMRMRPVSAVEVNPGEPAVLRPGGMHVMLMGLIEPLREGTTFPLTLRFERAGEMTVAVRVLGPAATGP